MEGVEGIFSGLSDTLKTNFMPIAVVLLLVLLVVGWLAYKSFASSSKNEEPESEVEGFDSKDTSEQPTNQEEHGQEEHGPDNNTSSE